MKYEIVLNGSILIKKYSCPGKYNEFKEVQQETGIIVELNDYQSKWFGQDWEETNYERQLTELIDVFEKQKDFFLGAGISLKKVNVQLTLEDFF